MKRLLNTFLFVLILLVVTSGCALNGSGQTTQPASPSNSDPVPEPVQKKPTAVYLDFEDILIPMALTQVRDRTVVVSTPGFKSGILTLKGRVDSDSLFNFFSNNMEKDNWEVISKIKSPGTTIMVFHKASRCAVITIRDEQLYTYVEIGVAPTLAGQTLSGQPIQKTGDLTY